MNISIRLSTSKNTATKKVEAFVVAYEVSMAEWVSPIELQ